MSYISAAGIDNVNGIATIPGFEGVFQNIIQALLAIAGILLFLMLVSGGIKYITSGGDPKKLESAKATLTHAIIGTILVAMGYLILVLIGEFTGNKNLLNFTLRP